MKALVSGQMTICAALDLLAEATWQEMEQGARTQQPLDEESITNYHLMRVAAAVPSIVVEKHTKKRERKSGADWEIWVGRPGAYIGFRVQAKVLTPSTAKYQSLYSSKAKALSQVTRLINNAESTPRRMYPIFAFYNYAPLSAAAITNIPCPRLAGSPLLSGWTVASAAAVRSVLIRSPSKSISSFAPLMLPISCLFCCPSSCRLAGSAESGRSLAAAVVSRVTQAWSGEGLVAPPTIHEIGPVYVERLFKGERAETGWNILPRFFSDHFVRERRLPRGVSQVVLVRDTE